MEKSITYFEYAGAPNTEDTLKLAVNRAEELNIKNIVISSTTGDSALKLLGIIKEKKLNISISSVSYHQGFHEEDKMSISEEAIKKLKDQGAKVFMGGHALSGVERAISNKFGGANPVEIIAQTLRNFGHGLKVAYEVSLMAADAGLIPTKEEVIAIGGRSKGVDTAIVLKPSIMKNFFDSEVREIICMPRNKKKIDESGR